MSDIEKLISDWRSSVETYAKAKAQAEHLKEFRKSKKAILMIEGEKEGKKTGQEREAYAYAHPEYTALLDGLKAAIEQSEALRWQMEIAKNRVEIWRTKQANSRREQSMYSA